MKSHLAILSLLIISLFCIGEVATADKFADLQARYLKLRNTDTEIRKPEAWRALSAEFEKFAERNEKSSSSGQALFNAGVLHEELWRKAGDENDLKKSMAIFEALPRDFPGDPFADDALLRVGDLWAVSAEDEEEARRKYSEIVEAYPDGDVVDVARDRLKKLGHKETHANKKDAEAVSQLPLVILDPGHGGEDLGAKGSGGLYEKDVVLGVALSVANLAKKEQIYQVRLTRRDDSFVSLTERTNLANDFDAKAFISLHVNSGPIRNVSGLESYYLDNTNDKSSQALAERENQYFQESGDAGDLNFILSDLIQSSKMEDSITLTNVLHKSIKVSLGTKWGKVNDHGVKKAPFYVLVGTHIPATLLEMMFINNPTDEKLLAQSNFRQSLAVGINEGIKAFLTRKAS